MAAMPASSISGGRRVATPTTLHTVKYQLDDFQQTIDGLSAGRVRGLAVLIP
jgi:hypothetical protein